MNDNPASAVLGGMTWRQNHDQKNVENEYRNKGLKREEDSAAAVDEWRQRTQRYFNMEAGNEDGSMKITDPEEQMLAQSRAMERASVDAFGAGRPEIATAGMAHAIKYRALGRAQAFAKADQLYKASGDPSVYNSVYNRWILDGTQVVDHKVVMDGDNKGRAHYVTFETAGPDGKPKRETTVMSDRDWQQALAWGRDPQAQAQLEAKRAEEMFKSDLKIREERFKGHTMSPGQAIGTAAEGPGKPLPVNPEFSTTVDGDTATAVTTQTKGEGAGTVKKTPLGSPAGGGLTPKQSKAERDGEKDLDAQVKMTEGFIGKALGQDQFGKLDPEQQPLYERAVELAGTLVRNKTHKPEEAARAGLDTARREMEGQNSPDPKAVDPKLSPATRKAPGAPTKTGQAGKGGSGFSHLWTKKPTNTPTSD